MAAATVERKYVMTRVAAGDYLLPSNDGKTIWRIRTYRDGPSAGLDVPRDFTRWGIYKWTGRSIQAIDIEDWDYWEMWDSSYETRQAAVNAALKLKGN